MTAEPHQPAMIVKIYPRRLTTKQLRDMLGRNPRDAARWMRAAAEAEMIPAQIVWGQLLLDGHGVAKDEAAAFAWFKKAAARGDSEAHNMVGRCYEQGWGVPINPECATESFEIAARAGHSWGQVNLAQMLARAGDPVNRSRCLALFKAVSESGTREANLKAMNSLARFLEEGWGGTTPDPAGAMAWYLKAANLGDHWAQYNLATILFHRGDPGPAGIWLRSAIVLGDNGFRRRIAVLLLARPELALRLCGLDALARCAADGAAADLHAYGQALDGGVAGAREPEQAALLFKRAAAKGYAQARLRLQPKRKGGEVKWASAVIRGVRRRVRGHSFPTPSYSQVQP